jgi:hypothetical protein
MPAMSTHRLIHLAVSVLLAGLALAGCTNAAQPTPRADGVIIADDFSNPQSGWDRHTGAEITTDYAEGRYLITIETANLDAWGLAGLDLNDMQVQAEASRAAGPDDNAFGVLCRFSRSGDQSNFYFFLISSDGYYAVGKVVKDERTYLNPAGDFEPLAAVRTGPAAVNVLSVTCREDELALAVNGTPAGTFTDGDLTHGDVGLIAGTFNEGGVAIAFDNVVVRLP